MFDDEEEDSQLMDISHMIEGPFACTGDAQLTEVVQRKPKNGSNKFSRFTQLSTRVR